MQRNSPWERRYGHTLSINSKNRLYLVGGFYADKARGRVENFNDVWLSTDSGRSWTQVVDHAPWAGRYQHAAVVDSHDDIVIVGGITEDLRRCADSWRSQDGGHTWKLISPVARWTARYEHAVVVDANNSLYVIGGMYTYDRRYNDVWRSERTCADDVSCPGTEEVCRDGTHKEFPGLASPICVNICDRRIFDKCGKKEACRVKNKKPTCIDPCDEEDCGKGEVCEVAHRGGHRPKKKERLDEAVSFCLACDDAKTKFACDKLASCTWKASKEACMTKCSMLLTKQTCHEDKDRCEWSKDTENCKEK